MIGARILPLLVPLGIETILGTIGKKPPRLPPISKKALLPFLVPAFSMLPSPKCGHNAFDDYLAQTHILCSIYIIRMFGIICWGFTMMKFCALWPLILFLQHVWHHTCNNLCHTILPLNPIISTPSIQSILYFGHWASTTFWGFCCADFSALLLRNPIGRLSSGCATAIYSLIYFLCIFLHNIHFLKLPWYFVFHCPVFHFLPF